MSCNHEWITCEQQKQSVGGCAKCKLTPSDCKAGRRVMSFCSLCAEVKEQESECTYHNWVWYGGCEYRCSICGESKG